MILLLTCFQGEDIQKLEEEITFGREQLQLADHLLSECNAVRTQGRRREGRKEAASMGSGKKRTKNASTTGKRLLSSKK